MIKDDLLRHKVLVQRFALNQSKLFISELLKIKLKIEVDPDVLETEFKNLINKQLERFVSFAEYESRFNSRIFSKYLKQKIQPIEVDNILNIDLPLALNTKPESLRKSFRQFESKKIAEVRRLLSDSAVLKQEANLATLFNGLFVTQAKALVTTAINCISGKVRIMF